jgi:hypothetical protein
LAWIIVGLVLAAAIPAYTLREKGEVSASMSVWKIFEFKLDAKEEREHSKDTRQ